MIVQPGNKPSAVTEGNCGRHKPELWSLMQTDANNT